jgi:hypothetical protein
VNPARLVQSIGWMAFLALMLVGGGYTSYIAAWQSWVLLGATALFGALVLFDALLNRAGGHHGHDHHDHDHGNDVDRWVQTVVHVMPLFLVLTLGVTSLGSQPLVSLHRPAPMSVLSHQDAGPVGPAPSAPATGTPAPDTPEAAARVPLLDAPTPAEPGAASPVLPPPSAAVPLPLLELYYPKKHPGVTRVETIGRVMIPSAEDLEKVPPEVDRADLKLLLYRYVMTCCAADASPVFVVLRGREVGELKVDEWVKVTGTWIPAPGLGDMAKLEVDGLEVIEQPKEPYLQAPQP